MLIRPNIAFYYLATRKKRKAFNEDELQCAWAKYQRGTSLTTNDTACNSAKLNNVCMRKALICPGAPASARTLNRRKRSTNSTDEVKFETPDPENPLEMIFHPSNKGKQGASLQEAKREYEENFKGMDMQKSYHSLFELLWYTQIPCFGTGDNTTNAQHKTGMIKSCSWKGMRMPCSNVFRASPTDRGMCCSFNVDAANEMFKSSKYQKMIHTMQEKDNSMALDRLETTSDMRFASDASETHQMQEKDSSMTLDRLDMSLETSNGKEEFTPEEGASKGLTLLLDAHSNVLSGASIYDDFRGFIAAVNDEKQFPSTSKQPVFIRPGHSNTVSIQVTKFSASPNIRKYPANKRNCYFDDEIELVAHNNYSWSKCMMECKIEKALTALNETQKSMCVPWFLPLITTRQPMCDPWEANDFQKQMSMVGNDKCKKCLPDCEGIEVRATVSAKPFGPCDEKSVGSYLCLMGTDNSKGIPDPPKWGQSVIEDYMLRGTIPHYIMNEVKSNRRSYVSRQDEATEGRDDLSEIENTNQGYDAYEKDIAMVTFFFESSNALEFFRQPKTSVIEFISQFGGLLGLCMGFSFISVVELIYWMTLKFFRNLRF